jgi:signal transduction histidine kinase
MISDKPNHPSRPRPSFRGRLWVRLLVAYLIPVAIIIAGIGWLAYRVARISLEDQLGRSLVAYAKTAADLVGRPRAVRMLPGDEESRTYNNLWEKLHRLEQTFQIKHIYLFDNNGAALVDSKRVFAIGEVITKLASDRAELIEVFKGKDIASLLFTGKDGKLYKTGFAPITIDGKVVAAVGVDGSAGFFYSLAQMRQTLMMVGLIALALVVLVTLFVSRKITRPVGRLAKVARSIGQGDMDMPIQVETNDEIGVLATTLSEMRKSLHDREQQLQMMLSGIAHEVRNPLGGMALFSGLLQEEVDQDSEASGYVKRINRELEYLTRVVNDFLDFARKKDVEMIELDINAELEQLKSLLGSDLEKSDVTLDLEVAAGLDVVCWDRERMHQALINLVRNAIQASPPGGRVTIVVEQSGDDLRMIIRDQGQGIDPKAQDKIFEPFFTTREKGTGLGLALVDKIVKAHRGNIAVESTLGKGTTFILKLPCAKLSPKEVSDGQDFGH